VWLRWWLGLTSLISKFARASVYPVIACSLFIVPGIPLINAVDDLLNNFIIGGTGRAMNALLIIGSMTFGIIVAIHLGGGAYDFTNLSMAMLPSTFWFRDLLQPLPLQALP
jgi:hypothetical protein